MLERRSFLQSALAAALLPPASSAPGANVQAASPAQLREALAKALADPGLAAALAPMLLDVGFTWDAPAQPAAGFRGIIA